MTITVENESCTLKIKIKNYFLSMRPWSFTASFVSVLLGCVLSWKLENTFDIRLFFWTLTTILSTHAAGNLVNTLYDFKHGIDTKYSDDTTLVKEILQPREVTSLIHLCYELAIASFLVICFGFPQVSVKHCLPLFMVGILFSFVYTGSVGLKYIAMGDVLIFVAFGPVITLFSFAAQTGVFSIFSVVCAVPLASLTEAILHCNNMRDLETDKKAGIVTMAILLGQSKASILYSGLVFMPYLIVAIIALLQSYWLALPILSLPLAVKLNNECWFGYSRYHHDYSRHHHDNGRSNYCHDDHTCYHDNSKREHDKRYPGNGSCNHNDNSSHVDYGNNDHSDKIYHDNNQCHHGSLENIPQKTAMLNLVFGILYVSGFLL